MGPGVCGGGGGHPQHKDRVRKLWNLPIGNLLELDREEWGVLPGGRGRTLPNLEAADEAMPSQQLENNSPQSVLISCPVQGKDIKAPEVQVLWKNNRLGRKAPLQISLMMAGSVRLLGVLPNEARKQMWLRGSPSTQVFLSTRETRKQRFASWVSKRCPEEHRNSS